MAGRLRASKGILVVLGTAAALAVVGATAWAAIPDASGTIHACIGREGALRVIDTEAGQACKSRESALEWSATGELPDAFVAPYSNAPVPSSGVSTEVVDLDLPPGKYQVTATANVRSQGTALDDPVRVLCSVTPSNGQGDDGRLHLAPVGSPGEQGTIALLASEDLSGPGTVALECFATGNVSGASVSGVLRAVEVGSITTEAGPPPLPN